jgi:hypothetical protein
MTAARPGCEHFLSPPAREMNKSRPTSYPLSCAMIALRMSFSNSVLGFGMESATSRFHPKLLIDDILTPEKDWSPIQVAIL